MKREARKVMEMVGFSPKNVETILLTYLFRQRFQPVGKRAILLSLSNSACPLSITQYGSTVYTSKLKILQIIMWNIGMA